ncbi:hypothetical protein Emed_004599 [Eimeria media]
MDYCLMCQRLRTHGSLACFLGVSVILSASDVTAFRSPVFLWAAANKPQSFFALSPHTPDFQEHGSLLSGIPEVLSSPAVSLLQVETGGEKDESEGESKASASESNASQAEHSQEQESSSEAAGGSEEQHGGDTSQEGSKVEKPSEQTSQTKGSSSKHEASSAEESTAESAQEAASEQAKASQAEEGPKHEASGQPPAKPTAVHEGEPSASASEAASKEESRSESTPLGASHKLTTESHVETPKGESSAHVSTHELTEKEKETKEETATAEVSKAGVPPATKTVVQLNFRPSMVLGSGEGDTVDRHVIAEAGGMKWYQVVGKKDLTILKLKPMEGEELLHHESVTEQPS